MIGWVKRRWSPDEFSRNVAILAGGTAFGQAVIVLASPLITRLYEPGEFGIYGAAASLISILAVVTPLGYHRAIALPDSQAQTAAVVVLSLSLSVITCAMTAMVLGFFGAPLLEMLNAQALAPFLWVIVIGQFGAAAYMVVSTWAVRARQFAAIARTRLIQGVGLVGFQLALSGIGGGLGLLLGDVIGRTAGTVRLGGELWRQDAAELRKVRLPDLRAVAVRYRRFPMYTNISSLLDALGLELPILLLVAVYGPTVGGLYLLVARVAGLPTALIGVATGQVFLAEAARMATDIPRLRLLFAATWRRLLKVGIVPALLGAVPRTVRVPLRVWARMGRGRHLLHVADADVPPPIRNGSHGLGAGGAGAPGSAPHPGDPPGEPDPVGRPGGGLDRC